MNTTTDTIIAEAVAEVQAALKHRCLYYGRDLVGWTSSGTLLSGHTWTVSGPDSDDSAGIMVEVRTQGGEFVGGVMLDEPVLSDLQADVAYFFGLAAGRMDREWNHRLAERLTEELGEPVKVSEMVSAIRRAKPGVVTGRVVVVVGDERCDVTGTWAVPDVATAAHWRAAGLRLADVLTADVVRWAREVRAGRVDA